MSVMGIWAIAGFGYYSLVYIAQYTQFIIYIKYCNYPIYTWLSYTNDILNTHGYVSVGIIPKPSQSH